jgi:hypothetical protein
MSHKSAINNLLDLCTEYINTDTTDGEKLNTLLRDISGILFYLETVRSGYHNLWSQFVTGRIEQKISVARAQVEADVKYPELYELRRTMDGAYNVVNAIRSNLSYLKSEIHNAR